MTTFRTSDTFLFVEPRLIASIHRFEAKTVEQRFDFVGIEAHQQFPGIRSIGQHLLKPFLVPDREHVREAQPTAEHRQVVVIYSEGHGR